MAFRLVIWGLNGLILESEFIVVDSRDLFLLDGLVIESILMI